MDLQKRRLSRGTLAAETGVNPETIRYYEKIKLMPAPPRSEGGHRVYDDQLRKRLCFIRRCRELGFALEEVRGMLTLVDRGEVSCERIQHLADEHITSIQKKITDLRRMKRTLKDLVGQCSGRDIPACPMIEALQR